MPIGYLITVASVAWCTFFALVPPRGPWILGRVGFRSGLALNELPFLAFTWLAAWTLVAFAQDGITSPGGWAPAGLAAATAAALAVIARRGALAAPAVERAMREGLGDGWRAALDPALAGRLRRWPPLAAILLTPLRVRRRDVVRTANIPYGDAGRRNLLDLYRHRSYRHRSRPPGGPTLIYLHGGGFTGGRKNREARPLLYRLASQGWVCVSADYRLRPQARFPDQLVDVKKVIAWVREHGPRHGADSATLLVSGSSAGAHLAAMAALTQHDPAFQPGFEDADTSVTAAICLYGYYGRLYGDPGPSSPLDHLRPDAPPFFIAHGDRDTCVYVEQARRFAGELRAASRGPVVYAELPGAQHSFDLFRSLRFEAVIGGIEAFAAWVRSRAATPQALGTGTAGEDDKSGGGVSGESPAGAAARPDGTLPRSAAGRAGDGPAGARPGPPG